MSAKTAIKEELKEVKDRIDQLEVQRSGLERALDILNGASPRTVARKQRMRMRKGIRRLSHEKRREQVLEWLRTHPNEQVSGYHLAERSGGEIPKSSAIKVVSELVNKAAVTHVGNTARGFPIVQYKPTTVRPGEEVGTYKG